MTNIFKIGDARFSVLTNKVVRMEYACEAAFCEEETLFAKRDAAYNGEIEYIAEEGLHIIKWADNTLYYKGGEFAPDTLWVESPHIADNIWHYGDESRDNLGGTLSTLDGVGGYKELPDGILSRRGVFFLDDSNTPILCDGWVKNRDENSKIDAYLFIYGDDYKGALQALAKVSGDMEMPRKYFFGSWYSRWYKYSAEEFLQIVDEYDKHGFPIDILVMDMDWHYHEWGRAETDPDSPYGYTHATNSGWTGYTWNRHVIPEPEKLIAELHRRGVAVTLNDHPADGVRDHETGYATHIKMLHEAGYTEQVPDVEKCLKDREKNARAAGTLKENYRFNAGSRDYMNAFFAATRETMEDYGADFRWLDWQQDYIYPHVNNVPGLTHLQWLNHLYYEQSKKGDRRGQSFSRWGGFGDQKHPAYFSGDTISNWECLDFEIQMTVTAGNAGCFWWSHDIGGFNDPVVPPQSELFARWVQFGATSPALRLHVCGDVDRRPWKWGEPFCASMRESFKLRSTLMPYIYSSAYESYKTSTPLLRPLYLENAKCEEAYDHPSTYYFGAGMISAPVTKAGEGENFIVESKTWLPEGQWYNWFDGTHYMGGAEAVTENDLFTFPLFAKAGYPIVTQEYTNRMTSAPLSPIVKIFCGKSDIEGTSTLFEDDGIGEGYKNNKFRKTEIAYSKKDNCHKITLTPTGEGFEGEQAERTLTVELLDCDSVGKTSMGKLSYCEKCRKATVTVDGVKPDTALEIIVE